MPEKRFDLRTVDAVGVTAHAMEKLRERKPGGRILSDKEWRAMLERAWRHGRKNDTIELWWERVDQEVVCSYIVDLGIEEVAEGLVGLVREDDRTPGRPCFVTVVTAEMARRSQMSGRWADAPEKVGGIVHTLAEQLVGITPVSVRVVVTWEVAGKTRFQVIPKETVGIFIEALLREGVDEKTVELWMKTTATIRRQITVDFGDT
jgi:hypothetical protein